MLTASAAQNAPNRPNDFRSSLFRSSSTHPNRPNRSLKVMPNYAPRSRASDVSRSLCRAIAHPLWCSYAVRSSLCVCVGGFSSRVFLLSACVYVMLLLCCRCWAAVLIANGAWRWQRRRSSYQSALHYPNRAATSLRRC